ncbi:MAG: histidinol phosphate phosphatase [Alphaproteobacteria bacterium]|nr:histidinol phosphate phosphatase [Alphaproteobacteria bacterium]
MSYWEGYRNFTVSALEDASRTVAGYYRLNKSELAITQKEDGSPVTRADRETEAQLRAAIAAEYLDDAIYGEEGDMTFGTQGIWVIDPIDGTRNFVCHNPLFGCLLGYLFQNRIVVGGVALPALNEIWIGEIGQPTLRDGVEMHTSSLENPAEAHLVATSPDYFSSEQFTLFDTLSKQVYLRQFGGDCTLFTSLASGGVDIVMEAGLRPHDYLPVVPIVEGAGGVITDWDGGLLNFDTPGEVLACASPALHQWALTQIREQRRH